MTKQLLEPESQDESTGLMIDFEEILKADGKRLLEEVHAELLSSDWLQKSEAKSVLAAISHVSQRSIIKQTETIAGHWLH